MAIVPATIVVSVASNSSTKTVVVAVVAIAITSAHLNSKAEMVGVNKASQIGELCAKLDNIFTFFVESQGSADDCVPFFVFNFHLFLLVARQVRGQVTGQPVFFPIKNEIPASRRVLKCSGKVTW